MVILGAGLITDCDWCPQVRFNEVGVFFEMRNEILNGWFYALKYWFGVQA